MVRSSLQGSIDRFRRQHVLDRGDRRSGDAGAVAEATGTMRRSRVASGSERLKIPSRERAFRALLGKVQRLGDAGGLGGKPVREAAVEFNAMMEGLGNAELRGGVFRNLPEGDGERAWRNALKSLVNGFAAPHAA
jgi:hypothetical protein